MTETMSSEWEKWLDQERQNIETLQTRIEALSSSYATEEGFQYREFWDEAKEIDGLFDSLTPLPPEVRDELRAKYNRICGEVKKRQDTEWQGRKVDSKQSRQLIEEKILKALSHAEASPEDITVLAEAQTQLSQVLSWLKGNGKESDPTAQRQETPDGRKLLRGDGQACWDKWRAANDFVFGRRQAIWERNYQQVQPQVQAAVDEANDGDPFQALDKVKEAQTFLKENPLSKACREEVRAGLNGAWDVAIAKVNEIREEKRSKHEKWQGRMESNLGRWSDVLQKNKEEASDLEDQIKRLQSEIKSSTSPEYSQTLRDWIGEKRLKLKEINASMADLEERIGFVREKLSSN